jgi:DNA polymerase (family 10)
VDNRPAAGTLFASAALLEAQGANRYRVRAYRRAARRLLALDGPAARYRNAAGELELPGLGPRLRRKVGELLRPGRLQFYDDLIAALPRPVRDLLAVRGVGPVTAERLVQELGIKSVRGIGPVRERQLGRAAEALLAEAA